MSIIRVFLILFLISFSVSAQRVQEQVGFEDQAQDRVGYQAVKIYDWYIFVHPRGNADIDPQTGETYDQKNLQKGIQMAQNQGRTLVTIGKTYYISSGLQIDKYQDFQWTGNGAILEDIDGGNEPIIGCQFPIDNGDANLMVERKVYIGNLTLKGFTSQNGIEVGPSYGSEFVLIKGENLNWVIYCRFQMLTLIKGGFATNCINGWAFGNGNWVGATWSNSQSNHSRAIGNRWYGNSAGTAFLTEHSSGVIYEGNIIEGFGPDIGFEMNAPNNTVVKDWTIRNTHLECVNGFGVSAIYARWAGGIITVDKIGSGHPTILADIASTPGYTLFKLENAHYTVPKLGQLFNNMGNVSWKIIDCDNQLFDNNILSLFGGIPVTLGCSLSGGPNRVCKTNINR